MRTRHIGLVGSMSGLYAISQTIICSKIMLSSRLEDRIGRRRLCFAVVASMLLNNRKVRRVEDQ
jgi:hypothetical protein